MRRYFPMTIQSKVFQKAIKNHLFLPSRTREGVAGSLPYLVNKSIDYIPLGPRKKRLDLPIDKKR